MKEELDREKKAITRQWAKREEQIDRVMMDVMHEHSEASGLFKVLPRRDSSAEFILRVSKGLRMTLRRSL